MSRIRPIVLHMKSAHISTETNPTSTVNFIVFDVTDSSAVETLVISAWKYEMADGTTRYTSTAHITYKSNPDARYLYFFEGLEATSDLYLALLGATSAGKVATYIRDNADEVTKHVDGQEVEIIPSRKSMKVAV